MDVDPFPLGIAIIIIACGIGYLFQQYQLEKKIGTQGTAGQKTGTESVSEEPKLSEAQYAEILERCKARGIEKWEDDPDAILNVIMSFLHKSAMTPDVAKRIYEDGINFPIRRALEEEERTFRWDEEHKDVVGRDKYLYGLLDEMERKEKEYDSIDVESAILSNAGMKPVSRSSVASAALAGATLGTAAGVAAGARTQAQNDSLRQSYDSLQDTLSRTMELQQERKQRLRKELKKLREDIAAINDFDIIELDGNERDKYMKRLRCETDSIELSESKRNLCVLCKVVYGDTGAYQGRVIDEVNDEDSEFFGTYFRLDGVIKLVATYQGEDIGEGFLFGHTFGRTLGRTQPMGFHAWSIWDMHNFTTDSLTAPPSHYICEHGYIKLAEGASENIDVRDVKIKYVPYHLWLFDNHSLDVKEYG